MDSKDAICSDISKCYSACMYEPYDEWMIIDFNDNWENFNGEFKNIYGYGYIWLKH
jgi:hypothetical protein